MSRLLVNDTSHVSDALPAKRVRYRPGPVGTPRISIEGKFLAHGDERFWIKGVTYGTFSPNDDGEPFPPFAVLRDDFSRMRDAGINTVRLYTPPSDRIADAAADVGLMLVPDICWGIRTCELSYPDRIHAIRGWVQEHSRRLADHPAILMFSIGNEIPPLVVRWYGRQRVEAFLASLAEIVRQEAPRNLITYANHPPTEYLNLPFLDVVAFNVYLEREPDFRAYLTRLQMVAGERPLFLAELGMDSSRNGMKTQAAFLDWQLRATWEKGLCGAAIYSWTDEWAIHQHAIEGWSFGLTDFDRRPKQALETVEHFFAGDHYDLRRSWPRVSVVVCSYNGARTLDDCLLSLAKLNYPNYDVIVVDDGSTDATREVLSRHHVRTIHVPNGGLSRARNLGIAAASGPIVAYIDSDAYADPDWLYYLVQSLEEHGAASAGGPNLSPPQDGFLAQCIDCAPGNPMHVLIENEAAEHVPGCNMAFRIDKLEEVGRFDPTHRAAGDDVDVCWKLLARREKIAFSPSAIVWHHRRPTIRGFWKQQVGYGAAEAHLQRRYPGRFNWFGDLVWAGSIYDGAHTRLRREGLPSVFRPRVYQGRFGSAQFQSIYQPFLTWWFQIFTTAEWHVLTISVLCTALLSVALGNPYLALGFSLLLIGMTALTIGAAAIPAVHAANEKRWSSASWWRGVAVVAALHLLQPIARTLGRIRGWRETRKLPPLYQAERRLYGNLDQREKWLDWLPKHLAACGWVAQPCNDWEEADLKILGPGPYVAELCSVYEEDHQRGKHYIRFRITAKPKAALPILGATLLTLAVLFVAIPVLLPLLVPLVGLAWILVRSKRAVIQSVAQLAEEAAASYGMVRVYYECEDV
jgi:glycosyltransferase involved in cell wall biosynthesis